MICSDDLMCDCYVDNADCVIHYDIPIDKKTFSIRFSVLQDSNTMLIVSHLNLFEYKNMYELELQKYF